MVKIVFFDCDGTLTNVKSSWEYLHRRLGVWDDNADAFQKLFREGKIDYHEFCRRDAVLWKGLPVARVMEIIDEIAYHDGAGELVRSLKEQGIFTVILSTGLSFLVEKVRKELGISEALSNELLVRDGCLTGEIRINVEHDKKGYWVRRILGERGVAPEEAVAIGDGEGDRGMFEAVGLSIGYHPQPAIMPLLDHALFNGSLIPVIDIIEKQG
jgi:phosphoserine phosphatase